ncbi:hypothetical protein PCURB6_18840 [Paenibacillus curdlanolyticus]|nr:hypothetical protein PCURB6_18840 [Paenibacillus curdlanolyticus]
MAVMNITMTIQTIRNLIVTTHTSNDTLIIPNWLEKENEINCEQVVTFLLFLRLYISLVLPWR